MIPQKLTIEGLYSYQERQTIDFTKLMEAGLFGIFGNVGSGKSTILEAITFSLYGETERLNNRENRTYNMMNLKSNKAYIDLEFINFEQKLYRITREYRRNTKKYEDVKLHNISYYENINGEWLPLDANVNIEAITGLSYSNFKRTIIIPQGQFKEFLELGAAERTRMMKEIFGLQRFDLQQKVKALIDQNQSALDQLEGELKGYDQVSEEQIAEKKKEWEIAERHFKLEQTSYEQLNAQFLTLKSLYEEYKNLQQKKAELASLETKKEEIATLKNKVNEYEHIWLNFKVPLDEKCRVGKEFNDVEAELKILTSTCDQLSSQKLKLNQEWSDIQPKFEQTPIMLQRIEDLKVILEIKHLKEDLIILAQRTAKGIDAVKDAEHKALLQSEIIQEKEQEIQNLESQLLDNVVLLAVGEWFSKKHVLEQQRTELQKQINIQQQGIQNFEIELAQLGYQKDAYNAWWESKGIAYQQQKEQVLSRIKDLEVHLQIAQFAHELEDGKPCQLCGSTTHPQKAVSIDLDQDLAVQKRKMTVIEEEWLHVQQNHKSIEQVLYKKGLAVEQIDRIQQSLAELKQKLALHIASFNWAPTFDAKDFALYEKVNQEQKELAAKIKVQHNELVALRGEWDDAQRKLTLYKDALAGFKLAEGAKLATIDARLQQLKVLAFDTYVAVEIDFIVNEKVQLEQQQNQIVSAYESIVKGLNDIQPLISANNAKLEDKQLQINKLSQSLKEINESIDNLLNHNNIKHIDHVNTILSQSIDVSKERQLIETFHVKYESLKLSVREVQDRLESAHFKEQTFLEIQDKHHNATQVLGELSTQVSMLEKGYKQLMQSYENKKELLERQGKLQNRATNLSVMNKLFTGAGFVEYVSAIYLKQLCEHANVRFHKMTHNQLSLRLNEKNDFEIIDFLNEGKSRSVKTLSGGQAFQVSLSLALALAESVQSNAKAEKNFFFIDEGFGTQDRDAVNVVFETLKGLLKENRIVGIISHVEELKEQIPIAINVTKNEEKGSIIEYLTV